MFSEDRTEGYRRNMVSFIARVWDGKGPKPTNIMIKGSTVQEIRKEITAAGFTTCFTRVEDDDPHIVETWM